MTDVLINPALPDAIEEKKVRAAAWFAELRDVITNAFEEIEDDLPADASLGDQVPGGSSKRRGSAPTTTLARKVAAGKWR